MKTYELSEEDKVRLEKDYSYNRAKGDQGSRYGNLMYHAKSFAEILMLSCPRSRELSLALTNLEQSVMWAIAAIARNEKEETSDVD